MAAADGVSCKRLYSWRMGSAGCMVALSAKADLPVREKASISMVSWDVFTVMLAVSGLTLYLRRADHPINAGRHGLSDHVDAIGWGRCVPCCLIISVAMKTLMRLPGCVFDGRQPELLILLALVSAGLNGLMLRRFAPSCAPSCSPSCPLPLPQARHAL